ncbi:Protein of unknown function [Mesobacillus persicus]|uniref:DUF3006 domain-containing protein n=1 Tax=Mesobacillus persicus TaxID=930146 RepID=A0A1H8HFK9_9BACI|nr:DUF3006 domain-containing protein [Mesobacillus persicus]SEN54855.1 Protein of unknown function [Mesobacillus persicus]
MKGYLDRIEDEKYAVILIEDIQKEFVVNKNSLPEGSSVKSYFDLTIENDKITSIKLNEGATASQQKNVDELMSKLQSKSKTSKFKKQ